MAVISGPTMTFEIKETLALNLRCLARECVALHGTLQLKGVGANPRAALANWAETFEAQWADLFGRDESELNDASRVLRRHLQELAVLREPYAAPERVAAGHALQLSAEAIEAMERETAEIEARMASEHAAHRNSRRYARE